MQYLFSFIFIFFVGVSISLGIGAFIGYLVWLKYKNKQTKKAKFYVIWGGILYIVPQPIILILFFSLITKLGGFDNVFAFLCVVTCAVLLAISFTMITLIFMAKRQVKLSKSLMYNIENEKYI